MKRLTYLIALLGTVALLLTGCAQNASQKPAYQYQVNQTKLGERTVMVIPTDGVFVGQTDQFSKTADPLLFDALDRLQEKAFLTQNIHVAVYGDAVLSPKLSKQLTLSRAAKVAGFFWAHGIAPGKSHRKLTYSGEGNLYPIATNIPASGKEKNRRIEIIIYPKWMSYRPHLSPFAKSYAW